MKTRLFLKILIYFTVPFLLYSCGGEDEKKPEAPVANAGADVVLILPESQTALDGSLSTDADGTINTYSWELISGPASFSIASPQLVTTDLTDLVEGTYSFRLTVTDNDNLTAEDIVNVEVSAEQFYFEGNMDDVTITTASDGDLVFNGWNELKDHPLIQEFEINNIGGVEYANQEMEDDTINAGSQFLHASIINDDPDVSGTTRAQMTMRFEDDVDLQVYHTSHRIYLHPNVEFLENYGGSVVWFTIVEIWNKHVDEWDGDPAGSARWNLAILKETGVGKNLYWRAESEYMQPDREQIWRYNNSSIAVPIGEWFTLDIYMKRGEGDKGKMKFTITPDGGSPQVLFDIANTTIYPGHPEIHLKSWQAFKLYLDPVYLKYLQDNSKTISAYYNDFKWHKN